MPRKNPNAKRFGGPGSSQQDREHPEKIESGKDAPAPGTPTSGRSSKISGGGGERDEHHSRDPRFQS
jgi:hypothetical protein